MHIFLQERQPLQLPLALQAAFAQVCNALAPLVQSTRTWNRVALHHMAYKTLRERFPAVGSQMVCNAIYSVSRHSRALFQTEGSPFFLGKLGNRPLPMQRWPRTSDGEPPEQIQAPDRSAVRGARGWRKG